MDEEFGPAAMAIIVGDHDALAELLDEDPGLATRLSSVSHPNLLQLIACEEPNLVDPVGSARLLMDAGSPTSSALVAAAGCNAFGVLDLMLDRGIDVDGDQLWTPLDEAVYWSNREMADHLLQRGARVRALSTAAGLGDLQLVLRFFEGQRLAANAGPIGSPFPETIGDLADDPQSIIDHAFVMAVDNGFREVAELLHARGAGVNATPPGFHWAGTALHAAVQRGDLELVTWLLEIGADPSIKDGMVNSDALGWARHHQHADLVALLSS